LYVAFTESVDDHMSSAATPDGDLRGIMTGQGQTGHLIVLDEGPDVRKSTVLRALAERLGESGVDVGLMILRNSGQTGL
jgi:hypothetical protein